MEFIGDEAQELLNILKVENKKEVYASSYTNEHLGLSLYKQFNLKRWFHNYYNI